MRSTEIKFEVTESKLSLLMKLNVMYIEKQLLVATMYL